MHTKEKMDCRANNLPTAPPGRSFNEIQAEINLEREKIHPERLKENPLSDDEQETILRRIIDLLNERKAVYNG